MQVAELKLPSPDGVAKNVTVPPAGAIGVPGDVSLTVAVQVDGALTGTLEGEHDTLIEDDLLLAVTAAAPELEACRESPP